MRALRRRKSDGGDDVTKNKERELRECGLGTSVAGLLESEDECGGAVRG
jgi:hypothetical protein